MTRILRAVTAAAVLVVAVAGCGSGARELDATYLVKVTPTSSGACPIED
jgi:hypothetical protein